MVRCWTFIQ